MTRGLNELFSVESRVAIVTGGATGIGRQMTEALAQAGADVVIFARDIDRCRAVAAEITASSGRRILGLHCDIRAPADIQAVVDRTVETFGRIDVLVNNAGTTWGATPQDMTLAGWQKVLGVNLTGVFLFSQAAGRLMLEQGRGKIVNIASIMGLRGASPDHIDAIAYNANKAGVVVSLWTSRASGPTGAST